MRGSEHPYTGQRSLVDAEWQRVYGIYVYTGLVAVVHRKGGSPCNKVRDSAVSRDTKWKRRKANACLYIFRAISSTD